MSPAHAVPANLWLDHFRPGVSGLPGNQIPAERDSTAWDSLRRPGFDTSEEVFEGLTIAGDYLYVAYSAGFSIWDIGGANAENPVRTQVRDGWHLGQCQTSPICGPFLSYPLGGHNYFRIEDIAVLAQEEVHYIAVSGQVSVGTSLWRYDTLSNELIPIYQDADRASRQVRLVESEGSIFVLASHDNGLEVYNLTAALDLAPCLEEAGSDCPGVYLGNLGTISTGRYLDVLERPTGEILVAATNGHVTRQALELWELEDPSTPGSATRLFAGLGDTVFGPALFSYEGNDYLAALERDAGGNANVLKIFNINACREGPCTLGAPVFDAISVPPRISPQFLTFSTSQGTPFLYYGFFGTPSGPKVEQLLNLRTLGRPNQNITEMTDGGPVYFDQCANQYLGYWAWYYPGNEFGLNNFTPRIGRFHPESGFFYRAATSVVDVHYWSGLVPTTSVALSNPDSRGLYWMSDEITFEAAGADGCNPAGAWTWTPTTPAEVNAVTVSEAGNQITYRFECVASGRCADAMIEVSATNDDPSCSGAEATAASLTTKDPTIAISAIRPDGGTFNRCSDVDFTARLAGRGPVEVDWSVRRDPALDPEQLPQQTSRDSLPAEDLTGVASSFIWTTSTASFAGVFADGFESGDTTAWGTSSSQIESFVVEAVVAPGSPSGSVTVELTSAPCRDSGAAADSKDGSRGLSKIDGTL